jgi:diaminopimelate epimerase
VKSRFYKVESAGNDFIVFFSDGVSPEEWRSAIPGWCHRRKGVGADGVVMLDCATEPVGFRIFNADGTEAEISGNGLMCAAAVLSRLRPSDTGAMPFHTVSGVRRVFRESDERFAVELGPLPAASEFQLVNVRVNEREYEFFCTRFPGNPHAIHLCDSAQRLSGEFLLVAPQVENLPPFPDRTNVEFVHLLPESFAQVRVWERGVGETLACGSGAAAISALLFHRKVTVFPVELRFPGGSLFGDVREGRVFVMSQVRLVFEGQLYL